MTDMEPTSATLTEPTVAPDMANAALVLRMFRGAGMHRQTFGFDQADSEETWALKLRWYSQEAILTAADEWIDRSEDWPSLSEFLTTVRHHQREMDHPTPAPDDPTWSGPGPTLNDRVTAMRKIRELSTGVRNDQLVGAARRLRESVGVPHVDPRFLPPQYRPATAEAMLEQIEAIEAGYAPRMEESGEVDPEACPECGGSPRHPSDGRTRIVDSEAPRGYVLGYCPICRPESAELEDAGHYRPRSTVRCNCGSSLCTIPLRHTAGR